MVRVLAVSVISLLIFGCAHNSSYKDRAKYYKYNNAHEQSEKAFRDLGD